MGKAAGRFILSLSFLIFLCLIFIDNSAADPSSTITAPTNYSTIGGSTYNITGTATDGIGSGLSKVEIGITPNGGTTTWYQAIGTASWSYSWQLPADGGYYIKSRATDKAGLVESSSSSIYVAVDNPPPTTKSSMVTGTYYVKSKLTLSKVGPGNTYYTTDGSDPTTASKVYSAPTAVNSSMTVKYFSIDSVGNREAIKSNVYAIKPPLWTHMESTPSDDVVSGMAADTSGDIFLAGYTRGGIDGNTNVGLYNCDYFITKYDKNGNRQWTKQSGTSSDDYGTGISTDANGNIYIVGYTNGSLDGNVNSGGNDIFIVKYDTYGNKIWTRQTGTATDDFATCVTTDAGGNVYIGGYTAGSLDGNTNAGGKDLFVIKYDSDGNKLWTRQLGTTADEVVYGICCDGPGNIYVGGTISSGGGLDGNTSAGGYDCFIVKYDSNGIRQWTRQIGSSSDEYNGVTVSDGTNVYLTGYTYGGLDGNTNAGYADAFVVKYDAGGNKQWTRQFGTSAYDYVYGAFADSSGIYLTGNTAGGLDGYPGAGWADIFVAKYDPNGVKQWTRQMSSGYGRCVTVDNDKNVYISGTLSTYQSLDGYDNAGGVDSFIMSISDVQAYSFVTSPADGYTFGGSAYTITGSAGGSGGVQKVEVSTDGGATWNPANGTTFWSYNWKLPANGTYLIESRATDNANNTESPSPGNAVVVNNSLPASSITSPTQGAILTGSSFKIEGTASDGTGPGIKKVEIGINTESPLGPTTWYTVSGTTSWSFSWTPPSSGFYTIRSRATDNNGNIETPVSSVTITIDNTPPVSVIILPASGTELNAINYTVSGSASDVGSGVQMIEVGITPNGGQTAWYQATGTATWSYLWTLPADGIYTIKSRATDNAGIMETPGTGVTVTVNKSVPASSIAAPSAGATLQTTSNIITGTAYDISSGVQKVEVGITPSGGQTSWYSATGTTSWNYLWTETISGVYTIQTRATNNLGRVETPKPGVVVTVAVSPVTVISSPASVSCTDGAATIAGTSVDHSGLGINKIEISTDNGITWTSAGVTDTSGNASWTSWSYLWIPSADGTYTIKARATDNAINVEVPASSIIIVASKSTAVLPATFGISASRFALDPARNIVYASIPDLNSVAVFDAGNLGLKHLIFVGPSPNGLALTPAGDKLFVALQGASKLAVLDTATFQLLPDISVPCAASDVAVGLDNRLYFTSTGGITYNNISQIDYVTGQFLGSFSGGVFVYYGGMLQVSPDRKTLYFGNQGLSSGTLAEYDVSTATASLLSMKDSFGAYGEDLALSHDGGLVFYVTNNAITGDPANQITYLKTSDFSVAGSLQAPGYPKAICLSPDDNTAYVSHETGYIDLYSMQSSSLLARIQTSGNVNRMITDAAGKKLFAAVDDKIIVYTAYQTAPSSTITSPARVSYTECAVAITGNSVDYSGQGINRVEISADGGISWTSSGVTDTSGNGSWTTWRYLWNPSAEGTYTIEARAADNAGNVETPMSSINIVFFKNPQATPAIFKIAANSFALDSSKNLIYASVPDLNSIAVFDAGNVQLKQLVFVGSNPNGMALTPSDDKLFVALRGESKLAVMDTATFQLLPYINLPYRPSNVAVGCNNMLYVTPTDNGVYSDIMQVDYNAQQYLGSFSDGVFIYYDGFLKTSPNGKTLFFGDDGLSPGSIAAYDISTATPSLSYTSPFGSLGSNGQDLVLSHDGGSLYYVTGSGNSGSYDIARINTSDMSVAGSLQVGPYPLTLCLSPDDKVAYVSHTLGQVAIYNPRHYMYLGQIQTAGTSYEMIVDATGQKIFAAVDDKIIVYDAYQIAPASAIASPSNGVVTKGNIIITGTSMDHCGQGINKVEISLDNGVSWTTGGVTDTSGSNSWAMWQYSCNLSIEGTYVIKSRATDNDGNLEVPGAGITVTVDNTPPASTINSPSEGSTLTGATYTIAGAASDNFSGVSRVEISIDGGTWNPAAGTANWAYSWTLPADGSYTIRSRATDNCGNIENPGAGITVNISHGVCKISLDKKSYFGPMDKVKATVDDMNANETPGPGNDAVAVKVTSTSDATGEIITLHEDAVEEGRFSGTFGFESLKSFPGNGKVYVSKGDTITVTYADTAPPDSTQNVTATATWDTGRAMWLRNASDIINDEGTSRADLFAFCASPHGNASDRIDTLYLDPADAINNDVVFLRSFITDAHSNKLRVECLMGTPDWATSAGLYTAEAAVDTMTSFNDASNENERFDGIHMGVDPSLLTNWQTQAASVWSDYLNLMNSCRSKIDSYNGSSNDLTYTIDIPSWFDTAYPDITSSDTVQDIADAVTVKADKNTAQDIISAVQHEMDYAQTKGKKASIGVETACGTYPADETFCEGGYALMGTRLASVMSNYAADGALLGMSIEDYASYSALTQFGQQVLILSCSQNGSRVTYTATMYYNSAPAVNKSIAFYEQTDTGKFVLKGTAKTNNSGVAKLKFTSSIGPHTAYAKFKTASGIPTMQSDNVSYTIGKVQGLNIPSDYVASSTSSGFVITTPTPTLTWSAYIGATGYRVQVSTFSTFPANTVATYTHDFITSNASATSIPWPAWNPALSQLKRGRTYYWRVQAIIPAGRGVYSAYKTLKYMSPTTIKTLNQRVFPDEIYPAPRSWAERAYPNLIYYNKVDKGGHFAAWEQPQRFSEEIRVAFRSLRKGAVDTKAA